MTFINNFTMVDIETWYIPLDIILIISLGIAIIFSLIFIIIIIIDKTCHTISMMLTANLCLGELVFAYGMLGIALLELENDLKQIQYQDLLCIVHPYLAYTGSAILHYSVVLQAFHRYIIVVYPTRRFWQSARFQFILICITWIISLVGSLEFILSGEIIYNIDNQACFIPFQLSFSIIYMILSVYLIPLSIQILIYIHLVYYVKKIHQRVTPANTLSRAQRELKMIRHTIILVMILLTFGIPYVILVIISFSTKLPKYYFRIACISLDVSLVPLMLALFQFTGPVKTAVMKRIKRRPNVIVAAVI